jgi:hypothetical protein
MKVVASLVILAASSCACAAFNVANNKQTSSSASAGGVISRRDVLGGASSFTVVAAGLVVGPSSSIASSSNANANDLTASPINGIYSDPNHKRGYRVVRAVDNSNAIVTLQDEADGPIITVPGKIKTSRREGMTLTLDLSKKGGPKNVIATLSGGSNNGRITFPDGNSWTKDYGVNGIYADPQHPSGYRIVREGRDGMVYITLQDEPRGKVIDLVGRKRIGGGYINIDFGPKGGPRDLPAIAKVGKLVFPDGNAWVKL